jgi:hypothetical protein
MKISTLLEAIVKNDEYYDRLNYLKTKSYSEWTEEDWMVQLHSDSFPILHHPNPSDELQRIAINNYPLILDNMLDHRIHVSTDNIKLCLTHPTWGIANKYFSTDVKKSYTILLGKLFKNNNLLINKWIRYFNTNF